MVMLDIPAGILIIGHCLWVAKSSPLHRRIPSSCNEPIWAYKGLFFELCLDLINILIGYVNRDPCRTMYVPTKSEFCRYPLYIFVI